MYDQTWKTEGLGDQFVVRCDDYISFFIYYFICAYVYSVSTNFGTWEFRLVKQNTTNKAKRLIGWAKDTNINLEKRTEGHFNIVKHSLFFKMLSLWKGLILNCK